MSPSSAVADPEEVAVSMELTAHVLADPDTMYAVLEARHHDPFGFLGMHQTSQGLVVRTFQPDALAVEVVGLDGAVIAKLDRFHEAGFFAGPVPGDTPYAYRLQITWPQTVVTVDDPYRFHATLSDDDLWRFVHGEHTHLYEVLGAHPRVVDGVEGVQFAVWAPNARRVSVVGDFNMWDGRRNPMRVHYTGGVWDIFMPGVTPGSAYKYEILGQHGLVPQKADPFGRLAELRPNNASVVAPRSTHVWGDDAWMRQRAQTETRSQPVSVYEVHLSSWRRGNNDPLPNYRDLAAELIPYVQEQGFTHIELMPITEFPFDGSWGYQPVGLYAPTRRFGMPDDFRAFVDQAHQAGIGIILDWVPGHFPLDAHGLAYFDGTSLFEHADPRQGFHPDWNTGIFNYGRPEVKNYLMANALYWLREFHLDGLRVDAVASMLYLDYSRNEGEWIPNCFGGRENFEAIHFLRRTNELVYAEFPNVLMTAEESTAFSGVSAPTWCGGLGFGYKWNMGWMHDSLEYFKLNPIHRRFHQNEITFSILYAFSENYVLPLSHDEVVHGKGSLLSRMPGDGWQQFANLRALYTYMFTHPGKKLLFMGSEFAQGMEWSADRGLDWFLLEFPQHRAIAQLIKDLNRLYRSTPALHQNDHAQAGFEWIDIGDSENSVISYVRRAQDPADHVVVVCNFTPVVRDNYRIGIPEAVQYRVLFNSDERYYEGSGTTPGDLIASTEGLHGRPASLELRLPPLGVLVLTPNR